MDANQKIGHNGNPQTMRPMPQSVRGWKWWANVKDRYFAQIAEHADGFGRASAFPDIERLKKVRIFDTTGRDGMQMPDAFITVAGGITATQNKIDIAVELAKWGIPIIEVGSAMSSPEEKMAIREAKRRVMKLGLPSEIVSLARMNRKDIEEAWGPDVGTDSIHPDIIHLFSSGSDPHTWVKFGKMPKDVIPDIVDSVTYAQQIGFRKMVVSLEDAARTDPKHLVEVASAVNEIAKARGVEVHYNIPDTIGVADPVYMFALISYIHKKVPSLPLQVHCHNDLGRAVDNSLAAIYAGVSEVHATMHGMGERTGNAALEQIVMNLYTRHGVALVDPHQISRISEFIRQRSGVDAPVNAPVIGRNAFRHESGVHGDAVDKSNRMGYGRRKGVDGGSVYAPFNPAVIGRKEEMGIGPLCGRANVEYRLAEFGITVPDDKIADIVEKVKRMSDSAKVSDADFILMAYESVKEKPCEKVRISEIDVWIAMSGARAYVQLGLNGHYRKAGGDGNGPVDAAVEAIKNALGRHSMDIVAYENKSIGQGSDAGARVTVTVKKRRGKIRIESSAVGTDTVLIAVEAFRKGYNAMCALETLRK
ncbi:hypothetical protein H0O00_00175 [Candidatus Micrarchaeota archaeon]|nr:hypothetical protein [Candidatus Micrarchaeota archaeon]